MKNVRLAKVSFIGVWFLGLVGFLPATVKAGDCFLGCNPAAKVQAFRVLNTKCRDVPDDCDSSGTTGDTCEATGLIRIILGAGCSTPRTINYCQGFLDQYSNFQCATCQTNSSWGAGDHTLATFTCPGLSFNMGDTYRYILWVNDVTGVPGSCASTNDCSTSCFGCCTPNTGCSNCLNYTAGQYAGCILSY